MLSSGKTNKKNYVVAADVDGCDDEGGGEELSTSGGGGGGGYDDDITRSNVIS